MSLQRDCEAQNPPLAMARAAVADRAFLDALGALKSLSRRTYQQISESGLPRSTAHHVCRGKSLPAKRSQVVQFVIGCGEPPDQAELWAVEWDRLTFGKKAPEVVEPDSGGTTATEVAAEPFPGSRAAVELPSEKQASAATTIFVAVLVVQVVLLVAMIFLVR